MRLAKQLALIGVASALITLVFFDRYFLLTIPISVLLVTWLVLDSKIKEPNDLGSLKEAIMKMGVTEKRVRLTENARRYAFFPSVVGEGELVIGTDYAVMKVGGKVQVIDKYTALEILDNTPSE